MRMTRALVLALTSAAGAVLLLSVPAQAAPGPVGVRVGDIGWNHTPDDLGWNQTPDDTSWNQVPDDTSWN